MSRFSLIPIIIIVILSMFAITSVFANAPIADAGVDQTIDQDVNVLLDGSGSMSTGIVVDWNWSFKYDGGTVNLEGETVEFTFEIPGVYDINLTVTDAEGLTGADVVRIRVRDIEPPVANAGSDLELEMGEAVTLDGSASTDNLGIISWNWSVHMRRITLVAEEKGETVTVDLEPGLFIATLTVTDAAGNEGVDEALVIVEGPDPPMAVTDDRIYTEPNERVSFDGTWSSPEGRLKSYFWTFEYDGEEVNLSGSRPSFTFIVSGEYRVTLTVVDVESYSDHTTTSVIVRDTIDPIPRILVGKDQVSRRKIILNGKWSEDMVGITNWTWTIHYSGTNYLYGHGTEYIYGESVEYSHHGPGEYDVTLIVKDGAGNSANTSHIFTVKASEEDVIPLWLSLLIIAIALSASASAMLYIRSRFKDELEDPDKD